MAQDNSKKLNALGLAEKLAEPAHFLIVDDEHEICAGLERGLNQLGCTASIVHDGASALTALNQIRFAGVLLDIRMTGIDGFDVIAEMKRRSINVPVLVVTGYPSTEVYQLIDSYGVLAVIVKPFSIAELTSTLRRYFSIFNVKHCRA